MSGSSAASSTPPLNCIDRHVHSDRRNKAALIWVGEDGEEQTYTYSRLYREVNRFANALKRLGVKKGDRVILYMPLVPEGIITHARLRAASAPSTRWCSRAWAPRRCAAASRTRARGWSSARTSPSGAARSCRSSPPSTRPCASSSPSSTSSSTGAARARATRPSASSPSASTTSTTSRRRSEIHCDARADGRGGSAVHPLHLRHHRHAQGRRARHRRLPGGRDVPGARLLPDRRARHLLVHLGHRLDRRPLVHRLRAAVDRRDRLLPRGRAGLPVAGGDLGAVRALRRQRHVHRADGGADVDEPRRRGARRATTCRGCGWSPAPASRSTPRRTSGRRSTWSASPTAWWSTTGGRPRSPAPVLGTLPTFDARPGKVGKPLPGVDVGGRRRGRQPGAGRAGRAARASASRCRTCCARSGATTRATSTTGSRSPACYARGRHRGEGHATATSPCSAGPTT